MPTRPQTHRPSGSKSARSTNERSGGTAAQRGYGAVWQKARKAFLSAHSICFYHELLGEVREATTVDHFQPVEPTDPLFLDPSNWRPACADCNRRKCATPGDEFVKRIVEEARRRTV